MANISAASNQPSHPRTLHARNHRESGHVTSAASFTLSDRTIWSILSVSSSSQHDEDILSLAEVTCPTPLAGPTMDGMARLPALMCLLAFFQHIIMAAVTTIPPQLPQQLNSPPTDTVYLPPLLSRLPQALLASASELPSPAPGLPSAVGYTTSRLPSIDPASVALHKALLNFHAVTSNYATSPYQDAFNWSELELPLEVEREWYIVAFRSLRHPHSNTTSLYAADHAAHEEAVTAGGLLLYWYGSPNPHGENLATCIWASRHHAMMASRRPKHAVAAKMAAETYASYDLERYVLQKERGESGVSVRMWEGGEVGF
ncbi:MAG: hypothetical protein Q9227_005193 [Pyrenula ochraceoflavens]